MLKGLIFDYFLRGASFLQNAFQRPYPNDKHYEIFGCAFSFFLSVFFFLNHNLENISNI